MEGTLGVSRPISSCSEICQHWIQNWLLQALPSQALKTSTERFHIFPGQPVPKLNYPEWFFFFPYLTSQNLPCFSLTVSCSPTVYLSKVPGSVLESHMSCVSFLHPSSAMDSPWNQAGLVCLLLFLRYQNGVPG